MIHHKDGHRDEGMPASGSGRSSVARVYDRVAPFYDLYTSPMEWLGGVHARRRLMSRARGRVLEVGVGTGLNLGYYPDGVQLTGVDISERMLERARRRAAAVGRGVRLVQADIEQLDFPDTTFDTVTGTCVFCSVADPVRGLRELRRVVRPDGQVLLYEHVRPSGRFLGALFDVLTPATRRLFGPSINRRTEENVRAAGLRIVDVRSKGIWREIVAVPD